MDIRSFFGAGGLKKSAKKDEQPLKNFVEEKKSQKSTFQKVSGKQEKEKKSGGNEKKVEKDVLEISDEEIEFKKSKKRKLSDEKTNKVKNKNEKESSTEKSSEKKKKEMKRKVLEEEEDEDVMNVKKKHKPTILPSDSEEEDPLPRSLRKNSNQGKNSIEKAFTQVVPKQFSSKSSELSAKKSEPRKLLNAIDFFGSDTVASKNTKKKDEKVEESKSVEKKEEGAISPAKTLAGKLAQKKSKSQLKDEKEEKKEKVKEKKEIVKDVKKEIIKEEKKEKVKKENIKEEKKEEKVTKKSEVDNKQKKNKKSQDDDFINDEGDEDEKKKKKMRMSYAAFKQREPPRALGTRELPECADNSLEGMVFVLTGVYETVEREEVKEFLERYGGKVTTSVSRNTSYLVVGRDPGQSKVDKAKQVGTKQINEDALFEMVAKLPGKKSKYEIQAEKEASTPKSSRKASKNQSPSKTLSRDKTPSKFRVTSKPSEHTAGDKGNTALEHSVLWTDKYKPSSMKQLVGQQGSKSQANKLMFWLLKWQSNSKLKPIFGRPNEEGVGLKAALLSGPPGVGKTTTAQVVCKELNMSYMELNASDTRSKRSLKEVVSECLNNQSLVTLLGMKGEGGEEMKKHCLIMDEVDGMSGNEDRGGVQELIQLIKGTHIPIICLCNDRNHPKIRSLSNYCFDLRFQRPRVEQIKSAIMSIAYKEGLKLPPSCLNDVITAANHDLRQILLNMSMWTVLQTSPTHEQVKKEADNAKKDMHYNPFDVCRKVFTNDGEHRKMTLRDKSDLFFHDYNIAPLFVQENYLSVNPTLAKGSMKRHLMLLSIAADSMCFGDVVDGRIRRSQQWSLLPIQAMYASVLPGEYLKGGMGGMIQFPSWLGRNSSTSKNDRLLQELNLHTRISIKGNKRSLNQDYLPVFKHLITTPLLNNNPNPVFDLFNSYDLVRDDLENIKDLTNWSNKNDLFAKIDSKTKASLTRMFSKSNHLNPYSTVNFKKTSKKKNDEEEEEEDDGGENDADDDPTNDAMIMTKKATKSKTSVPKETAKKTKSAPKEKK